MRPAFSERPAMSDGAAARPTVGRRVQRLAPEAGSAAIGDCRDVTRIALAQWWRAPEGDDSRPYDGDRAREALVEDVVLMVSEVVTNACMHTTGPLEFRLDCTWERLRVEVTDPSPRPPVMQPPASGLDGGQGLRMVDRLARAWGYEPRGGGKAVWLEVACPPDVAV